MSMPLLVIVGPTASGKTKLAAHLAYHLKGEVISADSRQVFKEMTIGTGKDLDEFIINDTSIPYHLIDILEPGEDYSVFDYQSDFHTIYNKLKEKDTTSILCGGSGLYIESVLKGYELTTAPINSTLRIELASYSTIELQQFLKRLSHHHPQLHRIDQNSRKRLFRAIEIASYQKEYPQKKITIEVQKPKSIVFGININREERRSNITQRLKDRFQNGLIEEVEGLLAHGVSPEQLIHYGLEYKFLTFYLQGTLSKQETFQRLETAIHQYAKRQMTWFRGMEKRGVKINWIDHSDPLEEKLKTIYRHF